MTRKLTNIFFLIGLCLASAFFFRDFLTNFFFQDDFFNITLSQSQSLFSAFNIFSKPILNFFFFRPLTTQLFWGLLYPIFGLNPLAYHLVSLIFFAANIILVYKLTVLLTDKKSIHFLTPFLYAFSATHFYRLFFLSQFQEIALATFVLITVIFFIRQKKIAVLFFIFSLMCKETAVVVPVVLLTHSLFFKTKQYRLLAAHFLILALYIFSRIFFFGFATGGAYVYDFKILHVLNNFFWYTLWSLGVPESFVNLKLFFVSKFAENGQLQSFSIINPEIFTAFGIWGGPIVVIFTLFMFAVLMALKKADWRKLFESGTAFALAFFVLFLLPVAFFPFHKFAYSLTLPIIGVSFILARFISDFDFRYQLLATILFVFLSFLSLQYNLSHHWATGKAYTARQVFTFLNQNYSALSGYKNLFVLIAGNTRVESLEKSIFSK